MNAWHVKRWVQTVAHAPGFGWARALFSFSSMHAMRLALPLLAFPWLGRVLGSEAFGLLMYMCLFPHLSALCVEWGFPLGGARMAALARNEPEKLGDLLRAISLAKIFLAISCVILIMPFARFLPHVEEYPGVFYLALFAGFARGASPFWFYQGTNSGLKQLTLWDIGTSLAVLLMTLLFIHEPWQWSWYLIFYVVCKGAAGLWLSVALLLRYSGKWLPSFAIRLIWQDKALFAGLLFADLYHYVSQIICGFFLDAAAMGVLVALSKIIRALSSLVLPFTQTIFPEICLLGRSNPQKSCKILRLSLAGSFAGMSMACALAWVLAPWLLQLALGKSFVHNADVLRILLLAAPLAAINMVLGCQALIPYGHDRAQALASGAMAVLSLPLACLLASSFGLYGAAFIPLCAETVFFFFLASMLLTLCPQALFNTGQK